LNPEITTESDKSNGFVVRSMTPISGVVVQTTRFNSESKDDESMVDGTNNPPEESIDIEIERFGTFAIKERMGERSLERNILVQDECDDREEENGVVASNAHRVKHGSTSEIREETKSDLHSTEAKGFVEGVLSDKSSAKIGITTVN
jgi:hypothetical protein